MKNKRAAMEMSVGTIVTIVLLMTVLILGLVLVRNIFSSATTSIDSIDQAVKNEINKLFTEDNAKKIVVIPTSRVIEIQKGEDELGFGFSIRNVLEYDEKFSYDIEATEVSCPDSMRLSEAEDLITLGKERNNIQLPAGSAMSDPVFVRFSIPESAPPCDVRYSINVYYGSGDLYSPSLDIDLRIEPE